MLDIYAQPIRKISQTSIILANYIFVEIFYANLNGVGIVLLSPEKMC